MSCLNFASIISANIICTQLVALGQDCGIIDSGYNYEPIVPLLADPPDDNDDDDPVLTDAEIEESFLDNGGLVQTIRAAVGGGRRRDLRRRK